MTINLLTRRVWMSLLAVMLLAAVPALAVDGGNLAGRWEGCVHFTNVQPKVVLSLNVSEDATLVGTVDLPMQKRFNLPAENLTLNGEKITFELSTGKASARFEGVYSAESRTICGDFTQAGHSYPFELKADGHAMSAEE